MVLTRAWLVPLSLCLYANAHSQGELTGYRQYPQFRTSSGLPGSALPIDENGVAGRSGALSISIPVAYSLRRNNFLVGLSYTSESMSLNEFGRGNATDYGNGTLWGMAGFDGSWGRASLGIMFLSGTLDNVFNILYQPRVKGKTAIAIGIQDLVGDGGASGDVVDDTEHLSSRSIFAVATHPLVKGAYISAGIGTNRFRFGFLGASWNATPDFSLSVEHDGYNFNGSVVWHPVDWMVGGRTLRPGVQLATIRGKYLQLGIVVSF